MYVVEVSKEGKENSGAKNSDILHNELLIFSFYWLREHCDSIIENTKFNMLKEKCLYICLCRNIYDVKIKYIYILDFFGECWLVLNVVFALNIFIYLKKKKNFNHLHIHVFFNYIVLNNNTIILA